MIRQSFHYRSLFFFFFSSLPFSKQSVQPPSKAAKRTIEEPEHIATAETQHHYEQQTDIPHRSQQQQVISQNEYLALIRESERHAQAQENGAAQQQQQQQEHYEKVPIPDRAGHAFYTRNPGHPLAGSSLEKEIEKLVSSNAQQYVVSAATQHHHHHQPSLAPQPDPATATQNNLQQISPAQTGPQQFRSPVVYKNQNDIVYIPYQQQLQRDQYAPRPITRAKVAYISAYPPGRAPHPSEVIGYTRNPHTTYVAAKPQESFKDLYIQQQRENNLKRLQQSQQLANDNLNLQSHAQPLSINLLPKKSLPPPPPPAQPSQIVSEQSANSNIAQFAERLFKTPLDQQKPLSQEQFKALVAAGYPVEAVHVPIAVRGPAAHHPHPHPQGPPAYPQLVQRYSPGSVSLPYPQPFAPQRSEAPVKYQPAIPAGHQQSAPVPTTTSQPHRFYPQGQYPQQAHLAAAGQGQQYAGPYTYVLQQGENEESAAEQLRQQIIHEINSQTQTEGQTPPQLSNGFTPSRGAYQQTPAQGATTDHQRQLVASKPTTAEDQKQQQQQQQYYKRLEYY